MGKKRASGGKASLLQLRSLAAVALILLMVTGFIFGGSILRQNFFDNDILNAMGNTVSTDSIRPVIVLDPGHGGIDGGAIGQDGVVEKDLNLSIGLLTREMLGIMGFDVIMTRKEDVSLGSGESVRETKRSDLKARLAIMEEQADAVVMIHQNKFSQPQYHGAQMFYGKVSPLSRDFADAIRRQIVFLLQPENTRELKPATDDVWLLKNCRKPIVMAECGFLSNPEECKLLQDKHYQQKLAFAIGIGCSEAAAQFPDKTADTHATQK